MTLNEADSKLRRAHMYLWNQRNDFPFQSNEYRDVSSALCLLHGFIRDNEVERMRAIRVRFAQPDVACIGNGLYCRTRGGR